MYTLLLASLLGIGVLAKAASHDPSLWDTVIFPMSSNHYSRWFTHTGDTRHFVSFNLCPHDLAILTGDYPLCGISLAFYHCYQIGQIPSTFGYTTDHTRVVYTVIW